MQISESLLLIITAVITTVSALFCVISLATSSWTIAGTGLFCTGCPSSSAGLAVVAFIIIIAVTAMLILYVVKILPSSLRIVTLFLLFVASIFTMSSYAAYFHSGTGYSYRLMVVTHFFCYVASLLVTFWLGGSYGANIIQANQA